MKSDLRKILSSDIESYRSKADFYKSHRCSKPRILPTSSPRTSSLR